MNDINKAMKRLQESKKIVKEAFSEDLPDWVANSLKSYASRSWHSDTKLRDSHVAWDKASFEKAPIPKSARDTTVKDGSKLCAYRLRFPKYTWNKDNERVPNGYEYYTYIPGISVPDLWSQADLLGINSYGQRTYIDKMAFSRWQPYIVDFGYIDLNNYGTYNVRKSREDSKEGSIERNREKGQTSYRKYIGDGKYSDEVSWVTQRGYDKSGYKLDPDKYVRMLARMDTKDTKAAARRIEGLYEQIEATKKRASDFLTSKTAKDLGDKPEDSWDTSIELLSRAIEYIGKAVNNYKDLLKTLDNINAEKGKGRSEEDRKWAERWYADDLKRGSENIKEYLKDANEKLDKIK